MLSKWIQCRLLDFKTNTVEEHKDSERFGRTAPIADEFIAGHGVMNDPFQIAMLHNIYDEAGEDPEEYRD